jgi:hypothetical protein
MKRTWPEVRAVDWAALKGAYGTMRDVAAALELLQAGRDPIANFDEGTEILWTHVWHQGTIYEVTPVVLPFVLELVDLTRKRGDDKLAAELAEIVVHYAASARRFAQSTDDGDRAIGERMLATLSAGKARVHAWLKDTRLKERALATMLNVPDLAPHVLACEAGTAQEVLLTILGRLPQVWFGERVLEWAVRRLRMEQHPVAQSAAEMLAELDPASKLADVDAERILAAGRALGDKARLDDLRERFGFEVTKKSLTAPGETIGKVVLVERDWFVVQVPRNLTVRWQGHPFAEGDTVVLVDINRRSIPREVRGTGAKTGHAARFDDAGRKL